MQVFRFMLLFGIAVLTCDADARSLFQPPGANLTYGDVTHRSRIQSASSNPAAPAADLARSDQKPIRGSGVSAAAGIQYGNVDELFEFIDSVADPRCPG